MRSHRSIRALAAFSLVVAAISAEPLEADGPTGVESLAIDFARRAVDAERAGHVDDARALFRAAAACYRYVVLPSRLVQLDFLHETRHLSPSDLELPGFAARLIERHPELIQEDFFALRRHVEEEVLRKSRRTLDRARLLESRLNVRTPGVVPLEPGAPRRELESILDGPVLSGVLERMVSTRDGAEPRGERTQPGKRFERCLRRLEGQGRLLDVAEAIDAAARLLRESVLAYTDAQIESLRGTSQLGVLAAYRDRRTNTARAVLRHGEAASRAYTAAAREFRARGATLSELIARDRARRAVQAAGGKAPARSTPVD